ncbi:hypothetical protein HLB23_34525 [Nocardia uniformis]|uniref:Uncharacterized protein n=1 Tax=Nocardia uniformis TaxID=53432 RepID=A0A849CGL8_9NOCA|nr:hypothetical protein [Nocardia uniformis]NNH74909.1 hypothetical protein [Nocardia uniformis]
MSDRALAGSGDFLEVVMLWKIIGVVAVAWIALAIIGALIKGLFPILMISLVVFGLYLLYKAVSGSSDKSPVNKL